MTATASELIAPCGMNCALCASFLAYSSGIPKKAGRVSHCVGCRPRDKQCAFIKKRCARLARKEIDFCFECGRMPCPGPARAETGKPCPDLLRVDKLYRTRYGMSPVANLEFIRAKGMAAFLKRQKKEHACPECGGLVCVHNGKCYTCCAIAPSRAPLAPSPKRPGPRA